MKKLIILLLILFPQLTFAENSEDILEKEGSIFFQTSLGVGQYVLDPDYTWGSFLEHDKKFTPLFFADLSAGYKFTPVFKLRIETSGNIDSGTSFLKKSGEKDLNLESYRFSISPAVISKIFPTENQFLKALFYLKYRETKKTFTTSLEAKDDFTFMGKNQSSYKFLEGSHAGIKNEYSLREYLLLSSPDMRNIRVGFGYFDLKEKGISRIDKWYGFGSNTIGKTVFESRGVMLEAYSGEKISGPYSHFYVRYGLDNDLKTPLGNYKDRINDQSSTGFLNYGGEVGYKYTFKKYKNLNLFMDLNFSYSKTEWTVLENNSKGNDDGEVLEEEQVFKGFFILGLYYI